MRVVDHDPPAAPAERAQSGAAGPGSETVRSALEGLAREIRRLPDAARWAAPARNAVVYRGSLAPRVVFVGEAPGAEEDRLGVPFVGRSGASLHAAIARLGLAPVRVRRAQRPQVPAPRQTGSTVRPPRTCRPYLDRQLALLRPNVLVSLGASALRALDPSAPPVMQAAGTRRAAAVGSLFPLVHPAATLRSRRMEERWEHDLGALADCLGTPVV